MNRKRPRHNWQNFTSIKDDKLIESNALSAEIRRSEREVVEELTAVIEAQEQAVARLEASHSIDVTELQHAAEQTFCNEYQVSETQGLQVVLDIEALYV